MFTSTMSRTALDPRQPFCRADARRAGIPLARLLGPEFHRIFYDRYVSSTVVLTDEVLARTAVDLSPAGSFVSHHSAAAIWGGVVPVTANTHVSVTDRAGRSLRRGISAHLASAEHATTTLGDLPISTPEQTFVDLACVLDLVDLVILGDSLLHAGATTLPKLWSYVEQWHGRGARPARLALRYVRAGAESPMETRLRLLVVLAGLPEPKVNHRLVTEDGRCRYRFDLCWEGAKLILEYDGRQHAENSAQWHHDLARRAWLDKHGWLILVVTAPGIYATPGHTLDEVRDALRTRGVPVRSRYRTGWQRHFPGRP
jgi:very-short-patch-repair endonuclease